MPQSLRDLYFTPIFALVNEHTRGIVSLFLIDFTKLLFFLYMYIFDALRTSKYVAFRVNFAYDSGLEHFMKSRRRNEQCLEKMKKISNLALDISETDFLSDEIRCKLMDYRKYRVSRR